MNKVPPSERIGESIAVPAPLGSRSRPQRLQRRKRRLATEAAGPTTAVAAAESAASPPSIRREADHRPPFAFTETHQAFSVLST